MAKNTVTISCRIPSGIILDLYDQKQLDEFNVAPKQYILKPIASVTLKGAGQSRFYQRNNRLGGLAGTTDIEVEFWNAYKKQNPNSNLIKNNLIFEDKDVYAADDHINDFKDEKTGLEAKNPENPTETKTGATVAAKV